ncbi:MAG: selenocysteine-specific translation elongation factor [Chloroflexi bacterium]|nr:MAG: selenocysteine-specific translation elongation factor [Chloroflexota bacterium]
MFVLGTAGHVDHGKSTLVRALTGIDPDRLKEEKSRGMTIDLGFAWIDLPMRNPHHSALHTSHSASESVGIIDVPGHIDFIKNMLAGVGGIDAVLLVIAADEGVMPQTREHLAIVDLLAVPAGVVALTKTDLIDEPDWLELVRLDVAELLQGTQLATAPIVPVSAATGAGLDDLRDALAATLGSLATRRDRARPRLPVDRVFSLSGFGTVVTGTLLDGHLAVGDMVEVLPAGVPGRVRGLQTHKQTIARGQPGTRLAINLSGVGVDQVQRGDVVAKPGTLQSTRLIDVQFRLLADAPRPLTHNQRVDLYSGAAETPAVVRLLGQERLEPGAQGWLQLRLERPVVVVSGDRYILRQPSPSITLGGGVVVHAQPRRRWRRFDAAVLARFETLAAGAPDDILLQTIERRPFVTARELLAASELDLASGTQALESLQQSEALLALDAGGEPVLLTPAMWLRVVDCLGEVLAQFHHQSPLRRGMTRSEARSRLQTQLNQGNLPVRLFNALVERACAEGVLAADDLFVWLPGFEVRLTLHQQTMLDHLVETFARSPFAPPNQQEALRLLGGDTELLESIIEQGTLVRIGGDVLFRPEDLAAMVEQVRVYLRENGSITLAQARDRLQTSRKYTQALLEEMDVRRITRREGDVRVLRQ